MLSHQGAVVKDVKFKRIAQITILFCLSMSMIAQTEYKAKACFQALLRCRRFSRLSLNERNHLSTVQVKCEARAESNVFEFCRAEAFTRRYNLFASAKVERLFRAGKSAKSTFRKSFRDLLTFPEILPEWPF